MEDREGGFAMVRGSGSRRELLYGLEGVHLDAYDAVVKPHQVFAIRTYTLRRWASILGATGFWLLTALQQQCYRNPKGDDWCVVSRPVLAEDAGMSEATVHRYLHGEEYDQSLLCHWVQVPDPEQVRHRPRRWSAKAGKMIQPANRYGVVMDAPLAPVDQRGLAQFLRERGIGPGTPAAQAGPVLEHLAGLSLTALMDLCDELACQFVSSPGWEEEEFYPTVADVVIALGVTLPVDDGGREQFLHLCSRVQRAFTGQTYLGTQYFLREWMSALSHKVALVVVQLRSHCFWSAEERRDTVTMNFTHLAEICGCSARWLRTINDTRPETTGFFLVENAGRGKEPVFRVNLLEPIAPQHQVEYESLLRSGVMEKNGTDELLKESSPKENGMGEMGKGTDELLIPAFQGEKGTDELLETEPVNCLPGENGTSELLRTESVNTQNGMGERHVNTIITIANTASEKTLKQHLRAQARAPALALLLADFGIGSPADRRILALQPDTKDVRAWMLYTLTQKGLKDSDIACGYVINRLLGGDLPPPRFRDWARLSPIHWQGLWRAMRYGGAYVNALSTDLDRLLETWIDDFADVFPTGPFSDSVVDRNVVCDIAIEMGGDPADFVVTVYNDVIYLQPEDEEARRWLEGQSARMAEIMREKGILHRLEVLGLETTESSDTECVWRDVLKLLQLEMTRSTFNAWLRDSRLVELEDGRCVVGVHNGYAQEWLAHRLMPNIKRALERVVDRSVEVEFVSLQNEGG